MRFRRNDNGLRRTAQAAGFRSIGELGRGILERVRVKREARPTPARPHRECSAGVGDGGGEGEGEGDGAGEGVGVGGERNAGSASSQQGGHPEG